ncbi:hypothetical protein RND81_04G204000 [Saponaria officinalis]|uniref:SHSP domain-containing protein n=1 Tax=Saponaria officinalis TaxID=3572 RepID=A0AAW1LNB6_SAPOF
MASESNRPSEPEALSVPPLNSMPYIDPLASTCLSYDFHCQGDPKFAEAPKPTYIFLPYGSTKEERHEILSVTDNGVCLGGSAAAGILSPLLGKIDIGQSDDSYLFRVSLPGVAREDFTCDVSPDGQIVIKGVSTTGEKIVYKHCLKFEMLSQNLPAPGLFSISFKLPGPVDSRHLSAHFGIDGVFEGMVKKRIAAN